MEKHIGSKLVLTPEILAGLVERKRIVRPVEGIRAGVRAGRGR